MSEQFPQMTPSQRERERGESQPLLQSRVFLITSIILLVYFVASLYYSVKAIMNKNLSLVQKFGSVSLAFFFSFFFFLLYFVSVLYGFF